MTFEKEFLKAIEPLLDEVVALKKRLASLERLPGPPGEPGTPGQDGAPGLPGADADPEAVAKVLAEQHADRLRGLPGAAGRDGADGKSVDLDEVVERIKSDEALLARLKGADGLPGPAGADGAPGKDAAPEAVAAALEGNPEFVASVAKGVEATVWTPGVYREGKLVEHYEGRKYVALTDTAEEPGDSAHWKRVGTNGRRDTGGYDEGRKYEPGDIYHKDGATFYFDGVSHRLHSAKSVSLKDVEKTVKPVQTSMGVLLDKVKTLEILVDALRAEIAALKGEEGDDV